MATQKFSKSEAIRFGWNTMKNNFGFFIGLLIVVGIFYFVSDFIIVSIKAKAPILSSIMSIVFGVLYMVIQMGLIRISLRFCDNEKGKFADLFSCFPLFFKYLFGLILYELIVLGGIILLIIPGIIWGIKFQFFSCFIVDKGVGPIEALKKSSAITEGAKWDLFLFNLLLGLINLLGAICLLIGLFATIPTTMVAWIFVYRKLLVQTEII
ncbi:MAG: hypothetical protein H0Z16_06440 [Thermodesulfobacterium sp.]|nr:hypothetical protein [Thermodesulfobacterium sp.]